MPATGALDSLALAMDRVLAGQALPDRWILVEPVVPPRGPVDHAMLVLGGQARDDLRRALSGEPWGIEASLLTWLAKYADVGNPALLRSLYRSPFARRRVRRRLRRWLPPLDGLAPPDTVELLVALLVASRPPGRIGPSAPW